MIILVAILGVIISVVLGTLWYSQSTPMGKWHMAYLGFDKLSKDEQQKMIAESKPNMWKTYSLQMILSFITSLFIAFVTAFTVANGGPAYSVFFYVGMIWIAFTVPIVGQNLLWGNVERKLAWKKFFSDSLYNLVVFLIIGVIAVLIVG